jgi:hypothetical protein
VTPEAIGFFRTSQARDLRERDEAALRTGRPRSEFAPKRQGTRRLYKRSVADVIRGARDEAEVTERYMQAAAQTNASAATRRKWRRVVEARLAELRRATIARGIAA